MSEKRRDNKGRILHNGESQRKDGKYEYKYVDSNGKRHSVYSWQLVSTDKVPSGKKQTSPLRELEKKCLSRTEQEDETHSELDITLNQMFEKYLDLKSEIRPTTKETYTYIYASSIKPFIGDRKISQIKYSDLKTLCTRLLTDEHKSLSTVEMVCAILSSMFKIAVRDNIISSNPASGILSEIRKKSSVKKNKRYALTKAQQIRFLEFVERSEKYRKWRELIIVLLGTGLRVSEALALTWDDCDFDKKQIYVNKNLVAYTNTQTKERARYITEPKTAAGMRLIPMLDDVKRALIEINAQQTEEMKSCTINGVSGFVFVSALTNNVPYPSQITNALVNIVNDANDEEISQAKLEHRDPVFLPHITPHIFRHTFCTRLCESGMDIKVVQEIMGHSNIRVTMDIYNDATEEHKMRSFAAVEGKIIKPLE